MTRQTAEWVSKAEGDYGDVQILRRSRKRKRFDNICFLSQQCAEKYLKARLTEAGIRFQRTHNLVHLLSLLRRIEPLWLIMELRLRRLSDFAVAVRYPGVSPDRAAAR